MLYICLAVIIITLILSALCRSYKKEIFHSLTRKGHPLKFLYPLAARILDLAKGLFPFRNNRNAILMKQLCVKENVDDELYIFTVKRLAISIGVVLAVCAAGMLLGINEREETSIETLSRPEYGKGQATYTLDVDYQGSTSTIDLPLDAVKLTEDEILRIFDDNYSKVIEEMLGDNASLDHISHDINLINSYGNIKLKWDIDDTSLLSYNGEISENVGENELVPLSLLVTFTIDETSQVFSVPMMLTRDAKEGDELLKDRIISNIESNNSAYEKEVSLPDNLEDDSLTFRKTGGADKKMLIFAGIIGIAAVFVMTGQRLADQAKKRNEQMEIDFTEIVFKLSLLYEAGLSIFRAWERIVNEYDGEERYAYKEMRLTLEQIRSGAGEAESYGQFGRRCGLQKYIKLGNILEQNLTKGAKGMKTLLRQEAQDSFEERKRLARKKGEEASTKMLIPMIMMLVVVMVIVAVPALMSIGF